MGPRMLQQAGAASDSCLGKPAPSGCRGYRTASTQGHRGPASEQRTSLLLKKTLKTVIFCEEPQTRLVLSSRTSDCVQSSDEKITPVQEGAGTTVY